MLNRFLEDQAFTTPALKTAATFLLVIIGFGCTLMLACLGLLFTFAPVVSSVVAGSIAALYLYFQLTTKPESDGDE